MFLKYVENAVSVGILSWKNVAAKPQSGTPKTAF